jgi:hypothetical protein
MPQDRTLSILCTFSGYYDANGPAGPGLYGSITYSQQASNPPMVGSIVDPTGAINVGEWTNSDPSSWNDRVDITFELSSTSSCTLQNGQTTSVIWSINMNNDPNGEPAMLLMENDRITPASTSEVEASWGNQSQTQILVDDKDETKDYYFRPGIMVPAANDYYISCDPPLVNRGGG